MSQVKTAISIDERLFAEADQAAEELKLSRSAFYALALQEYLRRRDQERLTEELNAAYDGTVDPDDVRMLRAMRKRLGQATPEDSW